MTEPWLTGSHVDVDPMLRTVLHALEHATLDLAKWTEGLATEQIWMQPMGLGAVGFHLRHITGSTDRLFTYAQGGSLTDEQMAAMRAEETVSGMTRDELLEAMNATFGRIMAEVRKMDPATLRDSRDVGRKHLPTTVIGLLVHLAEHTMRHVGEAIITAKVVRASSPATEAGSSVLS